jgi:transposase
MLCEGENVMPRKPYPSDLNDDEWEKIKPLLPEANKLGRPSRES